MDCWKLEDVRRRPVFFYPIPTTINKFLAEDLTKIHKKERDYKKYGLSGIDVEKIFLAQGKKCAICKKKLKLTSRECHIDHDHITNQVRGILCSCCNLGLGRFKDNKDFLKNAITYLNLSKNHI